MDPAFQARPIFSEDLNRLVTAYKPVRYQRYQGIVSFSQFNDMGIIPHGGKVQVGTHHPEHCIQQLCDIIEFEFHGFHVSISRTGCYTTLHPWRFPETGGNPLPRRQGSKPCVTKASNRHWHLWKVCSHRWCKCC